MNAQSAASAKTHLQESDSEFIYVCERERDRMRKGGILLTSHPKNNKQCALMVVQLCNIDIRERERVYGE
jgi:hypothetical protein